MTAQSAKSADLHKRALLIGVPLAVFTVSMAAWVAGWVVERQFRMAGEARVADAVAQASTTVDQWLRERRTYLGLLAQIPDVVETVRSAGVEATRLGLHQLPEAELQRRYGESQALRPDTALSRLLEEFGDASDFAAILVTELHGFTVTSTAITDHFSHAAEEWWQAAFDLGEFQGTPEVHAETDLITMALATQVLESRTRRPIGVMRGQAAFFHLARVLGVDDPDASVVLAVVDSSGRAIVTRDAERRLRPIPDAGSIPLDSATAVFTLDSPTEGSQLVATVPTNGRRWWVVVREPSSVTYAAARSLKRALYTGAAVVLGLVLIVVLYVTSWLNRKVTLPVRMAGAVASRVADGDLSASVGGEGGGSEEVDLLLTAVERMVGALRKLVGQIRIASEESASMAEEISASTQEMSASTQEMANTCQTLSAQATNQAEMVRGAVDDATRISGITSQLADGAKLAAQRNQSLLETSEQHREHLLAGSQQLADLASDLEAGVEDARQLAGMSEEIEAFIKQARSIAAQTNMLALNAAIEASRATGTESRGFAVVADEVRKLANQAARAAATTSETVNNVLANLQTTGERLARLAAASTSVREIAEAAAAGLQEVAGGAAETSAWTGEISSAAADVKKLVEEITQRLQTIHGGTESVVAAAEQIAASAEEQSASTEEVAGSAAQLAEAADRLTQAVSLFRVAGAGGIKRPEGDTPPSGAAAA
jgi:methyl-accepting chemotaxis protein